MNPRARAVNRLDRNFLKLPLPSFSSLGRLSCFALRIKQIEFFVIITIIVIDYWQVNRRKTSTLES